MAIKADKWIKEMVREHNMISNGFVDQQIKQENDKKVISYGVSSYGYDLRCTNEFQIISSESLYNKDNIAIDPKYIDKDMFTTIHADHCIVPANSFVLAHSYESLHLPRNVTILCVGKSTYARCGLVLNVVSFESGWEGHITFVLSNTSPFPVKIYAMEGLAQILFFESDEQCAVSCDEREKATA